MMRMLSVALAAAVSVPAMARGEEATGSGAERPGGASGDVTVVTSERLTYDAQKQYALFENDVVVVDPQLKLSADKLTLWFDENGEAESIKAEGTVEISQEDKRALADVATYHVESGKIVLTGNPRVTRGRDLLQGETITFWRDHDKLVCEPEARLIIYPQKGGARDRLFGE